LFWPNNAEPVDDVLGAPNEKPARASFGASTTFPFMSLVGLSSILNSCSFLGGVIGRAGVALALPNANGLCETSVPWLLPLGGPKENVELAAGGAAIGDGPNVNGPFFSAPAGGVDGVAPNENGLAGGGRASGVGAELGRWPNKNPPADSEQKTGFGASIGVDAPDVG
jgi:hypothetical protein